MYRAYQKVLEVITAALLLGQIIYVAVRYPQIDGKIPTHYDLAGNPDAWSNKSMIFLLLAATIFLYILLTVIIFFPKMWNVPTKVTAQNQAIVTKYVIDMTLLDKLLIVACFFYMTVCSLEGIALGLWFTIFMLVSILGVTFYYTIRMFFIK